MDAAGDAIPGLVNGHVDGFRREGVYGWAWHPESPGVRVELELRRGNELIAVAVADEFRQDLADSGIGDGRHAFAFALPPELADVPAAELSVVAIATGEPLPRSDQGVPRAMVDAMLARIDTLEQVVGVLAAQCAEALRYGEAAVAAATAPASSAVDEAPTSVPVPHRIKEELAELRDKLAGNDAFLVRFDEIVSRLPDREEWEAALARGRRGALATTAVLALLSAAAGAGLVLALLR